MATPTLGYWDVRGIAGPTRYLLTYAGQEFVDKRYGMTDNWHGGEKTTIDLDFPNLPYYMDGSVKISQSLTILRHLARKHGLVGKNEADTLRVELAEQQAVDLRTSMAKVVYNAAEFDKVKAEHLAGLPAVVGKWSKFLGNRKFVVGDYVTYADFMLYDALDVNRLFAGDDLLDENLKAYMKRIEGLPRLDVYLAKLQRFPIFGPMAKWAAMGQKQE